MHSGFYFLHLLLSFVVALWVFTSVLRRKEIEMIARANATQEHSRKAAVPAAAECVFTSD